MKTITLDSGLSLNIDEAALNDMELLELFCEIDDGNPLATPRATVLLVGIEQKKKLYDHIRNAEGRVPIDRFKEVFSEILGKLGEKN